MVQRFSRIPEFTRTIEMTPGGQFVERPRGLTLSTKVGLAAFGVAVVAGMIAGAALALYVASFLLPIALVAAAVAFVAFRVQLWRSRRGRNLATFRMR
jgi:hypothetical protein